MLLYGITSIIIIKVIFDIYLLYDAEGYYEIKIIHKKIQTTLILKWKIYHISYTHQVQQEFPKE